MKVVRYWTHLISRSLYVCVPSPALGSPFCRADERFCLSHVRALKLLFIFVTSQLFALALSLLVFYYAT